MKINKEDAERLRELYDSMMESFAEIKHILRNGMSPREHEDFRYKTLGFLEPGLTEDHTWVTRYSSIVPLDKIVEEAEDSWTPECTECGAELGEDAKVHLCAECQAEETRRDEKHGLVGGKEDVAN